MSFPLPVSGCYRIKESAADGRYMELAPEGSRVSLEVLNETKASQKWIITVCEKAEYFKIASFDCSYTLSYCSGDLHGTGNLEGYLFGKTSSMTGPDPVWKLETTARGLRIRADTMGDEYVVDYLKRYTPTVKFEKMNPDAKEQYWTFERVEGSDEDLPEETSPEKSFQAQFFNLTLEKAAQEKYDIIIVGSGIGGGVLANDLYDTNLKLGDKAKRILLLEKGGVVFHSHCLNTARPAGLEDDRGQQNDTFFHRFKDNYKFKPRQYDWAGGPMYNLGGRSAAWGLFAPRVHDQVLKSHFHPNVAKALLDEYYDKAERLMLLSLPTTRRAHQHIMDRLNVDFLVAEPNSKAQWQWGRIASEFRDDKNYDFAQGAYSTIDKILEIAMSRPKKKSSNGPAVTVEHEHFKTVLNADVHSLEFDADMRVKGVNVQDPAGKEFQIAVDPSHGNVVLCAGSVDSPAILLRSGDELRSKIKANNGLRLTDHDIYFYSCSFRYLDPAQRSENGAMKLQTYVDLGDGPKEHIALVNMSVDASSFLPRGESPDHNLPQFIIVFMMQQKLVEGNDIDIENGKPVVKMRRGNDTLDSHKEKMKNLTITAMKSLASSAKIQFVKCGNLDKVSYDDIKLGVLPLGGVAHELGTLPMKGQDSNYPSCLDENLCIVPDICKGVYVCDLSCFPHSPEANPTLALAALAIRLSRHLNQRLTVQANMMNTVYTVNHSGARVKVWLTNYRPGGTSGNAEDPVELAPGESKEWERVENVPQGLFVFKIDKAKKGISFVDVPYVLIAHPGTVTAISGAERNA